MVGVASLDIRAQHQTAIDDQRHTLTQLSRVLAEDTSRYASVVDLVLRDVQSRIAELGIALPEQFRHDLAGEATFSLLRARVRDLSQASAIALIDATGRMVNSSRAWPPPTLDAHDRDFFQYFATHDDPAPYLGAVERSRVTDALTLFMARRIDGPHGEFLGVVVGALDIAELTGRYQAVLTQSGESITLLRRDGLVLARYPNGDTAVGQRLPPESAWYGVVAAGGGTYSSPGYLGPGPLIVSASPVSGYGMVVDFTIAESAALAGWRHQAIVTAAAALAASIGVVALFGVIAAQFRRLQRAAEALRAGERRIRDFAETGSDWFWEQDADLRFSWISVDSPVRRPEDQSYIGQTHWERAGADPADAAWAAHNADLAARRPFRDFRYHRLGRDGRELHVSISGNPVYDDAGRFIGYRGTGRDVTARMQAQEELREAKEQAEAASRVKSEFLATMTHELRTPLNAIIGFSEILTAGVPGRLNPKQAGYVEHIHEGGELLLRIVNDVLNLAQVDAGTLTLNEDEDVNVNRIADACIALIREQANAAGLRLSLDIEDRMPLLVVDPARLKQILLNLLSNAIKFTDPGGSVTLAIDRAEDGGVAFKVRDTGLGMTAAEIEVALQPFGQVDSSLSRRHNGTGLGLPLARTLAELHGGSLHVDSEKGRGTTMTVALPPSRVLADLDVSMMIAHAT